MAAPCTPFSDTSCEPDSDAAAVLFSGGSDSTLTASLLSERHAVVHLLTYHHRAMRFVEKSRRAVLALQQAHGPARFIHRLVDINPLMNRLFTSALPADLHHYGTYALPMCCGACKLAMHVQTILYCRDRGIRHAADGSNIELSELFPEQMQPVLALYRELYARYGIAYSNPVFDVGGSDRRLIERGITALGNSKAQHVVYGTQHSCAAGVMLYAFTLGVGVPILGTSVRKDVAARYIAEKIERICVPLLDASVSPS